MVLLRSYGTLIKEEEGGLMINYKVMFYQRVEVVILS
jgi:hypothetical protein